MLELDAISAGYGRARILHDLSLQVAPGEILCLLGRNGAGKTTTMKAVMGLLPLMAGAVRVDGQVISTLPAHRVAECGIGYIPQGRRLFTELTVAQNLEIGLRVRRGGPEVSPDHRLSRLPWRRRSRSWHGRARNPARRPAPSALPRPRPLPS